MDDAAVIVRIVERFTKLARPRRQMVWLKNFLHFFGPQIGKRFPVHVFHGDARHALVVLEMVNPHDVLVRQLKTAARLVFEVVEQIALMQDCLRKEFQRHVALQFFVACQPDNSHSASAKDLNERVTAENFLTTGKLPLSGFHCGAGRIIAHLLMLITAKAGIKSKPYREWCASGWRATFLV